MAEPAEHEDQSPASGFQTELYGTELIAAGIKSRDGTLTAYTEDGSTLTPASGVLTIPLDGRSYTCTPSADITSWVITAPTAPRCGNATIYFKYDTAVRAIAHPATMLMPDGYDNLTSTVDGSKIMVSIWSDPDGDIHCSAVEERVPA